jgi:hypothetical protein
VAYLHKARNVEPEKQPLLANDAETTFVVPAATDTHAAIGVLLETVFSPRSVQRDYEEKK